LLTQGPISRYGGVMRLIAAALTAFALLCPTAPARAASSPDGLTAQQAADLEAAVSLATMAAFCEWRSIPWSQDYLNFLSFQAAYTGGRAKQVTDFVIATKDAAAREIMAGDMRGNCARRYNPAALAEMERARGAGQIPTLTGAR
jgi:hypothetical protein